MKPNRLSVLLCVFLITQFSASQTRKHMNLPELPGCLTLVCDFHMHTVFSDGDVWPTVRVNEAWQEGLDAIAITDHLEYLPHSKDVSTDINRPHQIALSRAEELGLILIPGAEITRAMPPGHLNAIFIQDAEKLKTDTWFEAIQEAAAQGAFIFWNHPGWSAQLINGKIQWFDEHTDLLNRGWLHGIEVVNDVEHYPEALGWGLEKSLTLFGNSDIHSPADPSWQTRENHRPLTLVFAKSKTAAGIRDALEKQQTLVFFNNLLMGDSTRLNPFVEACLNGLKHNIKHDQNRVLIQISNHSDITFSCEPTDAGGLDLPDAFELKAGRTTAVSVRIDSTVIAGQTIEIPLKATNCWTGPETNTKISIHFNIE